MMCVNMMYVNMMWINVKSCNCSGRLKSLKLTPSALRRHGKSEGKGNEDKSEVDTTDESDEKSWEF